MEDDEAVVAAFMEATGCGLDDAFDRLASSGGHLGKAVNSFFSIDAGPSSSSGGSRRNYSPPPPPPQVSVPESSKEDDDDAVRARPPVPAARRTRVSRWDSETRVVVGGSHTRSPPSRSAAGGSGSSARVSRWDSETWISRHHQCGGGDPRGGDREADGSHNSSHRRRFRENIFSSDGDEDDEESNNSRRRRLNPPTELTSSDSESHGEDAHVISSDDDDDDGDMLEEMEEAADDDDEDGDMLVEMEEAVRPPSPRNRTFEELFKVPRELTYKGGFHAAKAHAARRARWLLANVQSRDLSSLHQNRDVWANDLVARCVQDRFVLWQADAGVAAAGQGEDGDGQSEAKKVLGYYGIPRDQIPVVVVVDPVTGQAMDVLHGSAACDLNDFMARLGPYTETTPAIPGKATTVVSALPSAGGVQSNTRPARPATSATTAPASSERAAVATAPPACQQAEQEQQSSTTTTTVAKQAVAVAPASCTAAGQQPESGEEEKVCKVRVRLADGRVVTKEFGSQCAVAALFAYCRSMLSAGGAPATPPRFRLRRIVGRATEEISDQNASFENLGLHLTTVSLYLD